MLLAVCLKALYLVHCYSLMSDIAESIVNSKIIRFADDARLHNSVSEVEDCDVLQSDVNIVYKWADANNMAFNSNKFKYVCFTPSDSNIYLCPKMNLIDKVRTIKDLLVLVLVGT